MDIALSSAPAYTILANPYAAAALGLVFATGLLFSSRASFKRIKPESAPTDMLIASVFVFLRLAAATVAIWVYKLFVPEGFRPFAIALAGGFVLLYTIELVRYAGLHKLRRPVGNQSK